MIGKEWLYVRGGRPVIYQPDDEFESLPEEIRYRHVRYEPQNGIDWTWEREWRIKTDELILNPNYTTLIVPNRFWITKLKEEHFKFLQMAVAGIGEDALGYIEQYKWHFIALEDLGVEL